MPSELGYAACGITGEAHPEGAKEWREEFKDIRGEKTGPKTVDCDDEPKKSRLPLWLLQEQQEYLLGYQICKLIGSDDPKLPVLREEFEGLADIVLQNHLDLMDRALNRRLLVCPGFS